MPDEIEARPNDRPDSIAGVILDELELILLKRDHPPRGHAGPVPEPPAATERRADKLRKYREEVGDAPDRDAALMKARVAMLDEHVTGLSFSGGGIRSGTFAVGFLQGLANLGLIGRFDYLSTVSGGGYAGCWLAAWLKREGDVKNVERQLDFSRVRQARADRLGFRPDRDPRPAVDEEPQPLRHLRGFSSYLFPDPGLLSPDLWAVIMIWLRNVSINLMMLFPLAMLAVLLARLGVFYFNDLNAGELRTSGWGYYEARLFTLIGVAAAGLAFARNGIALREFRDPERPRSPHAAWWGRVVAIGTVVAAYCLTVGMRWMLEAVGDALAAIKAGGGSSVFSNVHGLVTSHLGLLEFPSFLFFMAIFGSFLGAGAFLIGGVHGRPRLVFVRAALVAGSSGGFLFVLVLAMIREFTRMDRPDLSATFAVPAALATVIATMTVEVAIAGRTMAEAEREWWGRYSARLAIASILWLVGMGAALYLPGFFLSVGSLARVAIASGWLGSTALGVLTGRFVLPRLGAKGGGPGLAGLATLAPPVFLIGLLGAVGLLASVLLNSPSIVAPNASDFPPFGYYLRGVAGTSAWPIAALLAGFSVLAYLGFRLIDVNLFSLHAMYLNRLVRCYLGASRPVAEWKPRWVDDPRDMTVAAGAPSISRQDPIGEPMPSDRDPNPVTGFAPDDDLALVDLKIGRDQPGEARTYWGPHLLINATLNLVAGRDLAWRSRKGESFVLTPLYCGSETLGYRKIPETLEARKNLTLGRSMAISGAAVDPNMRNFQSRALTAFLTLFNARLGSWIQSPRGTGDWEAGSPRFGRLLISELKGDTEGDGEFVHLSDGGHFENTGVYELIRRRCRYIVAVDASDETGSSDTNLATLIRLVRIDFGVRIQIDVQPMRPEGAQNLSRSHAVVGRVRYDDCDQGQLPGVLVYIKISMTGDEPPDLQDYASRDNGFPYQPTDLRQSFDEAQFESYRCLGDHIATNVFEGAVNRVRDLEGSPATDYIPRLFSSLQGELDDDYESQEEDFIESTQAWIGIQRDLRESPGLARLSSQLYPERLPPPATPEGTAPPDYDRAEVHAVSQMIQMMENIWLKFGSRRLSDLPVNRGWVNVFRRWANTPAFQALWPELRTEYGSDFARFCRDELHLRSEPPVARRLARQDASAFETQAIARLIEEFEREWPDADSPGLAHLLDESRALRPDGDPPAWLVVQDPSPPVDPTGGPAARPFVVGIILAARFADIGEVFEGLPLDDSSPKPVVQVEFVVWMRRGFRSTDLGSPVVRKVLDEELRPALGLGAGASLPTLWARYPKGGEHGDDDLERGIWLNFLSRFEFRRVFPKETAAWRSTLLRRRGGQGPRPTAIDPER